MYENIVQLKMKAADGKFYKTDVLDTKGIFRLIESVPSPKAEPFKVWLASLGSERVDEIFDPELAIKRAISYYEKKGYDDEWIKARLNAIVTRKKLTDSWKECGINDPLEYAMLTNEICHEWSGMTTREYKNYKGLTKGNLRDNMSDIELVLIDLSEITTRDIVDSERPKGLEKNLDVAKRGGKASFIAKNYYEEQTGKKVIKKDNKRLK